MALAQTFWPSFISGQFPGPSASPVAAVLPADAVVTAPAPDVPAAKARWSGQWSGWACRDAACDTKLVVESVTAEGATIVYAFASERVQPFSARLQAKFVEDALRAEMRGGARIAYRMRVSGDLEFVWQKGGEWAAGVLSKAK
jgi:hypothetical protein